MDTKFWGPDGWRFLHSIVALYPDNPSNRDKTLYKDFFGSIKHVLPCIYCRNSFIEYTSKSPIDKHLGSKYDLCKWLYDIHNMVNAKLRGQGYLSEEDPSFEEIYLRYCNYVNELQNPNCQKVDGLDFLYCIAFNYPKDLSDFDNLTEERIEGYVTFLNILPEIYPHSTCKSVCMDIIGKMTSNDMEELLSSREKLQKIVYNIEKLTYKLVNKHCLTFSEKCEKIESYRAGCKKNTCRLNPTPETK